MHMSMCQLCDRLAFLILGAVVHVQRVARAATAAEVRAQEQRDAERETWLVYEHECRKQGSNL